MNHLLQQAQQHFILIFDWFLSRLDLWHYEFDRVDRFIAKRTPLDGTDLSIIESIVLTVYIEDV